ncbi:MAG TPA: LamG domain-containing protein [Phycisphaerales bacterium]|nr:LamG domain-containing protein [Phycisphaerales bacterium]
MSRELVCLMSFVLVLSITGNASADLVAHWRLDEGSGNTVYDSGTSGNNGTFEGNPRWVAGYYGGAVEFDGVDDNIDCGNDDSLDITAEITLSAWINMAQRPAVDAWYTIPWKENAYSMYLYGVDNTLTTLCADFWLDTGRADIWDGPDTDVPPNEWTYIAVTFNGTDFEFYVNGELDHTANQPGTIEIGEINFLFTQAGSNFAGLIDDVRLYDHALTLEEILAAMEGGEEYPYALSPAPKDGALYPDTWANLSWRAGDYAASHDVYLGDNFEDVDAGAEGTFQGNQAATSLTIGFPGFPYPDGLVPGTTYYWRIDEINDAEPNSPWKGNVWSFLVPPRTAYSPDPPDGAEFVDLDATFTWTGGFRAKLHTAYIGNSFDEVSNAAGGAPLASNSFSPGPLEPEKVYYWRIDESDPPFTYKGDVWSFTTPGAVGNPQPANGAVDVQMIETLSWTAADSATSHELYFGADADAVRNATTTSPEYIGPRALGAESYDPGGLAWDSSYAWRVDEVYPDGTVKGLVWTFATADFILVDDFESYNDIDPPDPNSNTIYSSWIDGYEIPTNGAITSEEMPPYAEQTMVHGGAQSMKYLYDTNLIICESTLKLVYPKDWTAEAVTKLILWFRGNSGNAADRMYVALNETAVVYHDDASATQLSGWNEWVIDLAAFGVDLANVNTITIGIGTKDSLAAGGTGTMYFDDIRLYR